MNQAHVLQCMNGETLMVTNGTCGRAEEHVHLDTSDPPWWHLTWGGGRERGGGEGNDSTNT